jgi:NAD(P) transhydrogenase subunit beta
VPSSCSRWCSGVITLPIGGADMPVVISLFNAFTGLAVGFEGFVMGIPALIIAGIVVGAAGTLLTQLMAKAMNRPISNILFVPTVRPAVARRSRASRRRSARWMRRP